MLKSLVSSQDTLPTNVHFVIDGGHLLQSVVWPKPATYLNICESYTSHVLNHYKTGATVVFDGYDGSVSTKSAEQNRRAKRSTSADIVIALNLPTITSQSEFLVNRNNKTRLIQI